MTKYREILRLSSLGFSNRNIALSVPCSRNTVAKVLKRAQELDISWPLEDNQTDEVLEGLFYPKQSDRSQKRMPDYDYIHKELLRNGVSKKLLWTEYMEDCRANGDEPLMYSQFCYHIQQDEQKRRAIPCTSIVNPVIRSRLTGQGILQQSLTRIPVKS